MFICSVFMWNFFTRYSVKYFSISCFLGYSQYCRNSGATFAFSFLTRLCCSDSIGSCTIVGDSRWAGAYGVDADFVAITHCSAEFIPTSEIQVMICIGVSFPECCYTFFGQKTLASTTCIGRQFWTSSSFSRSSVKCSEHEIISRSIRGI